MIAAFRHKLPEVVILGDFNEHNNSWLGSHTTDHAGRTVFDLAMEKRLSQLVESPTRLLGVENHNASYWNFC